LITNLLVHEPLSLSGRRSHKIKFLSVSPVWCTYILHKRERHRAQMHVFILYRSHGKRVYIRDDLPDMRLERRLRRPRQRYRDTRDTKSRAARRSSRRLPTLSRRSCTLQWAADPRSSLVADPAVLALNNGPPIEEVDQFVCAR